MQFLIYLERRPKSAAARHELNPRTTDKPYLPAGRNGAGQRDRRKNQGNDNNPGQARELRFWRHTITADHCNMVTEYYQLPVITGFVALFIDLP